MIKIKSETLEQAYKDAAAALECSVTELLVEVVQSPSSGILGFFKKEAIIVVTKKQKETIKADNNSVVEPKKEFKQEQKQEPRQQVKQEPRQQELKQQEPRQQTKQEPRQQAKQEVREDRAKAKSLREKSDHSFLNNTIMPESFVSTQDDEDYDMADINFTADYEDESHEESALDTVKASEVAKGVEKEINTLFDLTCFKIDKIDVSAYDDTTLLIEFKGEDAALLIGKEGYRYKALSYMIFNWINTKYQLQLRLEIAEFLKNQEESVTRYLAGVCENVDRDGRAQTKILDGVLVQIALRELREKYPNKYVAIRSTRDGLKFIIINDYHN